jgi:putative endonuclease
MLSRRIVLAIEYALLYNSSSMSPANKKKSRWFLYIVECSDATWYTGITCDIVRRLRQHNAGTASRYTRSRLPVKIIFQESCRNKSDALKKEFAIKTMTRKEKGTYIAQPRKKGAKLSAVPKGDKRS